MGKTPDHGVTRDALAAAAPTPLIGLEDAAGQHSAVGFESLPDDVEAELLEAAERGQVRAREGSVRHVEVFQMDGVGTSIFGRPRRLSGQRRADRSYTVNCEEPIFIRRYVDRALPLLGPSITPRRFSDEDRLKYFKKFTDEIPYSGDVSQFSPRFKRAKEVRDLLAHHRLHVVPGSRSIDEFAGYPISERIPQRSLPRFSEGRRELGTPPVDSRTAVALLVSAFGRRLQLAHQARRRGRVRSRHHLAARSLG